jgi:hypothetical protein
MENQEITKVDDNTISVIKNVPVEFKFTPEYLTEQRAKIVAQKEKDNAQRDVEIAEIDGYLAEMARLNVVAKPVEVVEPTETTPDNSTTPETETINQ